jgi:hypothetical protein
MHRKIGTVGNIKMLAPCKIVLDGTDIFVVVDGQRIAKRGQPDSPQDGTWVALEPGWTVCGVDKIEATYEPPTVQ